MNSVQDWLRLVYRLAVLFFCGQTKALNSYFHG
jgi:hypothetical protein